MEKYVVKSILLVIAVILMFFGSGLMIGLKINQKIVKVPVITFTTTPLPLGDKIECSNFPSLGEYYKYCEMLKEPYKVTVDNDSYWVTVNNGLVKVKEYEYQYLTQAINY